MTCHNVWLICQREKLKESVVWFHERTNDFFIFKEIKNCGYIPNLVIWKIWEPVGKWIYTQICNWWVSSLILETTQHWFFHLGQEVIYVAQRVTGSFLHMVLMFNLSSIIYCTNPGKWNSKAHIWILDSFH